MMSHRGILRALAVVVGWMLPSMGLCDPFDGRYLLARCTDALYALDHGYHRTSADAVFNTAWCAGYMRGWVDGSVGIAPLCVPYEASSAEQITRIVVKYLREHPERLHEHPNFLMLSALHEAFPCAPRAAPAPPPSPSKRRQR
jgi:hypothetical protein